jgi:hypothetical protein
VKELELGVKIAGKGIDLKVHGSSSIRIFFQVFFCSSAAEIFYLLDVIHAS